jgi:hypothetical protein
MRPGDVVAARFEIERLVGAGGMGAVYRARDRETGQDVAIKLLHGSGVEDELRFAREARVLSDLQHPGIVRHVAHGVTAAAEPYLAMEWIEGEDLARRLFRSRLSVDAIMTLGRRVAEALSAAHALGVVHRDIKPSNLLLPSGDIERVKVVDFGIARIVGASRVVTRTGRVIGTLSYLAPEQARGARDFDARVDVFALGCVLFECLTGRVPFEGKEPVTLLTKIVLEDAPRASAILPGVPAALDELLARMLCRDRAGRPADGARVVAEIAALDLTPVDRRAPASILRPVLSLREQRLVAVVVAGAAQEDTSIDRLVAAVEPFEARLERLDRDRVGAALAGPGSATDQIAHASRCAIAMRAVLPSVSMALCAGPAVLRGRLPVGPLVDRALVLAHAAKAGSPGAPILLDEVAANLLDPRFEVTEAETGELWGERATASSPRLFLRKDLPCVGRDREIALLEATLDDATRGSVATATLVSGPEGIGKSRVRMELLRRVRCRGDAVAIWSARGLPLREGTPFGAIAELSQAASGAVTADPEEAERAFPSLLSAACAAHPVVVLLEDLQWVDLPSLQCIDALLRRKRTLPLVVFGFARPEVHDIAPNLWVERNVHEIRLSELTRRASERLIRAALGDAIEPFEIERIAALAMGNPLCLLELCRGAALGRGGELSETVISIVLARLAAIPPEERRLLRAASIYRTGFGKEALHALVGGTIEEISAHLAALVEREILSHERALGGARQAIYAFRQTLMCEGAYRMLTDGDRALGHQLAEAFHAVHPKGGEHS